jgi:hypothetical protein
MIHDQNIDVIIFTIIFYMLEHTYRHRYMSEGVSKSIPKIFEFIVGVRANLNPSQVLTP